MKNLTRTKSTHCKIFSSGLRRRAVSACLAAAPIWLQWRQDSRKVEIENPFQYIFEMLQIIWVFFCFVFSLAGCLWLVSTVSTLAGLSLLTQLFHTLSFFSNLNLKNVNKTCYEKFETTTRQQQIRENKIKCQKNIIICESNM